MNARLSSVTGYTRRDGFTLIELAAVTVLLALLATVTVVRLHGPYREACSQLCFDRISQFDEQLRRTSRRFDRDSQLTIQLRDGTLEMSVENGRGMAPLGPLRIADNLQIDQVRTATRQVNYGQITIPFFRTGRSPTYALRLKTKSGSQKWLLFAGASGQCFQTEKEPEIDEVFRLLSSGRAGAG